ncbi:hypothetical protein [Actinophytocola sediminis]
MTGPTEQPWYVLIEETVGFGNDKNWLLSGQIPATDRDHAHEIAQHYARTYRPRHPRTSRGRSVYRVSETSWLVGVRGASRTYPFRISIAQLHGTFHT